MPEPNRLINEKSPYLLQHAHDPVNWYSWGEEAFKEASSKQLPVFLSIGYSSCHWCHVMHQESFQNEELAALINANFISIKVDREERPDVDTIYMSVCQALIGQGGWPLTIIMTPDKKPFYAATYLPLRSQRNMNGLLDVLSSIHHMWGHSRPSLLKTGEKITQWINEQNQGGEAEGELSEELLQSAYRYLKGRFDEHYGGFSPAPKFPTPHQLFFLLRYYYVYGEAQALSMVEKTLEAMYRGGIYDHVGFGFARYSTDRYWLVPHFEKMLYDNALLALAYLEAFQVTRRPLYERAAREIFGYVLRDMRSPDGGFFSSQDADSPGGEGSFYIWERGEIKKLLGEDSEYFCTVYGIGEKGNFEGKNVPNLLSALPGNEEWSKLDELRNKLQIEREKRPHPGKDDKILCAWNGLMIMALAVGARVLKEPVYLQAAREACDFLLSHLRRWDGRLLARYRDGEALYPAYLDDYTFLVWAFIELYETCYEPGLLKAAIELNDDMIKYFWDNASAGFYFYGWDGEELIGRPKEIYDGAMPSGNSVAALNLLRLSRLTGRFDLEEKAQQLMKFFSGQVKRNPGAHTFFLSAYSFYSASPLEITIVGNIDKEASLMLDEIHKDYRPFALSLFKEEQSEPSEYAFIPLLKELNSASGKATAYICANRSCSPPINSTEQFCDDLRNLQPAWIN